ncbi:hypothetical protein ACOSP7_008473 [Xanthoceras sorbifolium]
MLPWEPPANNARICRFFGDKRGPEGPSVPTEMLISGIEMSLSGWDPSDVLELQRTLVKFLKSSGLAVENPVLAEK